MTTAHTICSEYILNEKKIPFSIMSRENITKLKAPIECSRILRRCHRPTRVCSMYQMVISIHYTSSIMLELQLFDYRKVI